MTATRRLFLKLGASASALAILGGERLAFAQSGAKTIRAVLHTDLVGYDPIISTANIAAYHGAMVYDMLFGNDEQQNPQPQMVGEYYVSEDKLTWTFTLRDGLAFSDGSTVTTADVIPSLRRWGARSAQGQKLMALITDIKATDERTFTIALSEPFPLLASFLGSSAVPVCFIMRKREAEMDPQKAVDQYVGSGPFILNSGETRPGVQYVYDRNPHYVPRSEPASGLSGGKVVEVDRVIFVNMPDPQTALAALQAGEIDFFELPPPDFLPMLEGDPGIVVTDLFKAGKEGSIILNWLQPPFDNVKVRQAVLHAVDQNEILQASFSDPKWYKAHGSWFTYGSPMANDANTDWFKTAPNTEKAKALLKEAGYDGTPVVLLQATDRPTNANAVTVLAQQLRKGGFNVQIEAIDWATLLQRRPNKGKPQDGGWNMFVSEFNGLIGSNPYMFGHMATNGEKGWFGWPSDERNETLRAAWMKAETMEERVAIARDIQANAWDIVPHVSFGHWTSPVAHGSKLSGFIDVPGILPFWNVKKV